MIAGSPYASVSCFNKYAPLAHIDDEYCHDSMEIVDQYMVDDGCSFAAWGAGVHDLIYPCITFDKFDTLLVNKKMDYDTISQVKASQDYKACKTQMGKLLVLFFCPLC